MNTKIKIWTPETIDKLKTLISEKKSVLQISELLGLTKSAITTHAYNNGMSFNYNGKTIEWNKENVEKLNMLVDKKLTHNEIANEFECSVAAISQMMSTLKIKSKNINYFTDADRTVLMQLFNEGKSINHISKILNRGAPYVCRIARDMGLITLKSKQIQEQLDLSKEGKRICRTCNQIFPYSSEYFRTRSMCKGCGDMLRKGRYQSEMSNLTVERLLKLRFRSARGRASIKGVDFDIDELYMKEIYDKQNGLCFYSGIKMEIAVKGYTDNMNTLSVDRIDSDTGYIKGNIVLCCDFVNTMKMKFTTTEFLNMCRIIVDYNKDKPNNF